MSDDKKPRTLRNTSGYQSAPRRPAGSRNVRNSPGEPPNGWKPTAPSRKTLKKRERLFDLTQDPMVERLSAKEATRRLRKVNGAP